MNTSETLLWLANIFNIDESELKLDSRKEELEVWDSMGTLMLMAELDEQYDVMLTEDELGQLNSIEELIKILGKYKVVTDTGL